jgi:hypothetical protein
MGKGDKMIIGRGVLPHARNQAMIEYKPNILSITVDVSDISVIEAEQMYRDLLNDLRPQDRIRLEMVPK